MPVIKKLVLVLLVWGLVVVALLLLLAMCCLLCRGTTRCTDNRSIYLNIYLYYK